MAKFVKLREGTIAWRDGEPYIEDNKRDVYVNPDKVCEIGSIKGSGSLIVYNYAYHEESANYIYVVEDAEEIARLFGER